jgi:hypothetical protein
VYATVCLHILRLPLIKHVGHVQKDVRHIWRLLACKITHLGHVVGTILDECKVLCTCNIWYGHLAFESFALRD